LCSTKGIIVPADFHLMRKNRHYHLYCILHNVFPSKDNSLTTWNKPFQVYCSLQYHKTEFSSFQSLTARHRYANNILLKIYLQYYDLKKQLHCILNYHWLHTWYSLDEQYITLHSYTTMFQPRGLQTMACGPNPACEAIFSDPQSHIVNNEKVIHLRKICWVGRM